jgi:hypothetical protein
MFAQLGAKRPLDQSLLKLLEKSVFAVKSSGFV